MNYNTLTDRHKMMLDTIAHGLDLGYTKSTWTIFFYNSGPHLIIGLDDGNCMDSASKKLWYNVTNDDIDLFTELGLMQDLYKMSVSQNRYLKLNTESVTANFLFQQHTIV